MARQRGCTIAWIGIALCVLFLLLFVTYWPDESTASQPQVPGQTDVKQMISNIHWLGHAGFRIEGDGMVIYIDPWKLEDGPKADLILITHDHGDHCSPSDVAKILKKNSVIVTVAAAEAKLSGQTKVVKPGDEMVIKGVSIIAVPAYNINKFRSPGVVFHPRESGYAGFVLTVKGRRIYHAGDTDRIPEMGAIHADIALLPVSGIYVMTADEAAAAVTVIKPKFAIPMHVGRGIGSLSDAEHFKNKTSVPVVILSIEK